MNSKEEELNQLESENIQRIFNLSRRIDSDIIKRTLEELILGVNKKFHESLPQESKEEILNSLIAKERHLGLAYDEVESLLPEEEKTPIRR